jgi:cytoskeleton protein RodZ
VQGALIGVGPALKKARMRRGVSVDEAGRATKIRPDLLEALEDEEFDALLGEVYVRGALRSYSSYLGLDPERVLSAYANHDSTPEPPSPEPPTQIQTTIGVERRRDNHRFAIAIVVILLVLAAGFGILSSRSSVPEAADLPATAPDAAPAAATEVIVGVAAERKVDAVVTADGVQQRLVLRPGETRTFAATDLLTVRLSRGCVAQVSANGEDLGVVGTQCDKPWERTFAPSSVAPPSPSSSTTGEEDSPSPSG